MPTAAINVSTATTAALVAAPGAGKRVGVREILVMAGGTTTVTLKSGSTALTGPMPMAAQTTWKEPWGEGFRYLCADDEALNLTNSAAVQVSGSVVYEVVG